MSRSTPGPAPAIASDPSVSGGAGSETGAGTREESSTRRRRSRKDQRGVALLLVLSSIALMTITVVDFQEEQTTDLQSAFAERDALVAEHMAKSAVNLSRLWLASEPTMRQALGILRLMFGGKAVPQLPVWEFTEMVMGAFSDAEGAEGFGKIGGFDMRGAKNVGGPKGAKFDVVVVDEDAKINLNLGARGNVIAENRFGAAFLGLTGSAAYDPLFQRPDRDGQQSDRLMICGALMDWADPDENRYTCEPRNFQGGGATGGPEDQGYALLPRPYRIKNAPYDSLEEAHLVRGVGDDFWATFVDPEPSSPKKRVMTVWGQGPINVNTASPQAVLAVVCGLAPDSPICIDAAKSLQFLSMFGVLRSFTSGMPLFGSPMDFIQTAQGEGPYGKLLFGTIGIPPIRFQSPSDAAKNFTTESKVFSIYATGEVEGYKRTTRVRIQAVVDFRSAPALPISPFSPGQGAQPPPASVSGSQVRPPPSAATLPGQIPGLPPNAGPDAIAGALMANPAGTVVYYRVE